ncbi:MAG TPA: ABC transporter ATP-binding protein [Gemmatimonadales bacterium]|jgi:ABC-2 type transport system ATP-binding protein|nr:ABC transporter ATP-binding protein [Gemmatimonadales bacterium]
MSDSAVEIQHLVYRVKKAFTLQDLSLKVPTGSIYGFLGPNGSGKTTTIRLVLGLLRPESGAITVLGQSIPREAPRALARVGYVPEAPHLDPTLSVSEAIWFHSQFYPTWDGAWASRLIADFELDPKRPFGKLSKGQKGKLMMLLALAQRPELLVLDEPTDGLDPVVRRDMLSALLDYVSQHQATVFISSHLIHELERICDWVGVMDNGRLVADVAMELFKNGMKRLKVSHGPANTDALPFRVLTRQPVNGNGTEMWLVRDWSPEMAAAVGAAGGELQQVIDMDLEEGFVELLRSFRVPRSESTHV